MRPLLSILPILVLCAGIQAAEAAKVRHVSDGDSFILESGERVRMIGLNAPELKDPLGPEARAHLAALIRGKTVMLERDPQNDDRDIHGRLLRFVSLGGTDINRRMIADGFGYAFLRYPFARDRREAYREAERVAKESRLGIWASQPVEPGPVGAEEDSNEAGPGADYSTPPKNVGWIVFGIALIALLALAARLISRSRS